MIGPATGFPPLRAGPLATLQVNLGYRCNQSCIHCHVNAGPRRSEAMDPATLELVPEVLAARKLQTLDLTGGAPELHEGFRRLVGAARSLGVQVIDRCNLTVLSEPGQENLAEFLAAHRVEVAASLPCYLEENVDRQRGKGAFERSIRGLARLNALGYGRPGSGLTLNLVYNPQGPSLPPEQGGLEADYRRALADRFGIAFNRLHAIANMPIRRFGRRLVADGQFDVYMRLLRDGHSAANLARVMCLGQINVDWRGDLYDCDFNQQLGLPLAGGVRPHLRDLLTRDWSGRPIAVGDHCFGCTAGQGSSCGGALAPA